jgi:hypothetical protein
MSTAGWGPQKVHFADAGTLTWGRLRCGDQKKREVEGEREGVAVIYDGEIVAVCFGAWIRILLRKDGELNMLCDRGRRCAVMWEFLQCKPFTSMSCHFQCFARTHFLFNMKLSYIFQHVLDGAVPLSNG